jgi:serine O-acetyltransferase
MISAARRAEKGCVTRVPTASTPEAARPRLFALIAGDIDEYASAAQGFMGARPGVLRRISMLLTPSVTCCALHRVAHALQRRGWGVPARIVARTNALMHRVELDPAAEIGPRLYIPHPTGVVFQGRAGARLKLFTQAVVCAEGGGAPGGTIANSPRLGDEVTLGVKATILGPIEIGSRVRIGPGVVLRRSLPSDATVVAPHLHPRAAKARLEPLFDSAE